MQKQIKFVNSLPILPLRIENNENDYQVVVVKCDKVMYIYLCGYLLHKIYNLPTFKLEDMNDLFLKASSLTSVLFNINADYKFVINEYQSYMETKI